MGPFFWIGNKRSAQSRFVEEPFSEILSNFDLIIEIGTFTGVFTQWISEKVSDSCKIISYDNNPTYRTVGDLNNVIFRVCDFFNLETLSEIKSSITLSGRTLILCDGGDKETEFKILSRFMKEGDVIMLHDYEHDPLEYEYIKETIGWPTVQESHFSNLERYLPELNLFPYRYEDFKNVLWGSFTKKTRETIGISITTSRRIELFRTTIESLALNCVDKNLVDYFLHFDDSSSSEDRVEMEKSIRKNFPCARIYNFRFEKESISSNKRHMEIMRRWKKEVESSCDFVFHTEDDWNFIREFSLLEIIEFLKNKPDTAYIGVSQELREFPLDITPKVDGSFWKWHFDPSRGIQENLFLDTKIMKKNPDPNFWCYYINWPYFGFRPGVWDTKKISEFGWIKENESPNSSFELDFAKMLSEKYSSYCTIETTCDHIGINISAYDMNNSTR